MARSFDPAAFGCYSPNAGRPEHRVAAAGWLSAHRIQADPDGWILCNGAQHAIAIARSVFGEVIAATQRPTFHIWIPLPSQQAEHVAREALANGIAVTPPSAPIVDAHSISGIRVSLGSIAREELGPVLQRLRAIMRLGTAEPFII